MRYTKHSAVVTFKVPESVPRRELHAFMKEALEAWGGQRHPCDHLFGSCDDVRIKFQQPAPTIPVSVRDAYQAQLQEAMDGPRRRRRAE